VRIPPSSTAVFNTLDKNSVAASVGDGDELEHPLLLLSFGVLRKLWNHESDSCPGSP